ncbi:flagellar hook-length control protein FliK [Helicobacter cetorum]|uniref:Flagellar hook-length control protein-like C-terminal domain-containing protein n=1 Tax=Helicobacter cetorum (strain ATCC BAA-540 / CCUG 52418 / MIT 99-5656) TaxID=1163745 RepID=I0ETQ7_HELCM|nr:flagellar hook-length control protein FliK [Helicobacter cetorum]AFI06326.1 hypothetical protein HCD_06620 [Helicobacter cetorum MIT 99-5656]
MPSQINPIQTPINTPKSETNNAPKNPSSTKDFNKLLKQTISKNDPKNKANKAQTTPKELPNHSTLKDTPKTQHSVSKKIPTHKEIPQDKEAPTLKDLLKHTENHDEAKPKHHEENLSPMILPNKSVQTPTSNPMKTPLTPPTDKKESKTLKDVQTLAKKHDLNISHIKTTTHQTSSKETPTKGSKHLSTNEQLSLKTTPKQALETPSPTTTNLSSVLQSLETKDLSLKDKSISSKKPVASLEKANLPSDEKPKKMPPLNESLQTHAIKRAKKPKVAKKKKPEKTPSLQKNQVQTTINAPKETPRMPPLTPLTPMLMGLNTHGVDFKTPLEKEEKTPPIDTKESIKENTKESSMIQNTQNAPTSDNKGITPKETIKHFSQQLKQEIQEYKPPMTKISMDLFPKELGKLEVTIQKVGKNLKVSVISNHHSLQTFLDNQQELKNSLSALGFEGVDLSFSQNHSKEQHSHKEQELTPLKESALKRYQENTNDDFNQPTTSLEITLYA